MELLHNFSILAQSSHYTQDSSLAHYAYLCPDIFDASVSSSKDYGLIHVKMLNICTVRVCKHLC